MNAMELVHADNLTPDQLMVEDLIQTEDGIVEIISIDSDSTGDNYSIGIQNEFGERETLQYAYTDSIKLYVFIEDEEE